MTRILAIMGSGETAPTMIRTHRELFELAGPGTAVGLDTPYGFQVNAEDISRRTREYFADSVGRDVTMVSWRRNPGPSLERERALATVRAAAWVFAGPGSPTYALRQWRDTPLVPALRGLLEAGGVLVFASAAAVTLGAFAVPVYEVYKAGADPHWEPGLDLVTPATGLPAVVVPHFDNAEGGHYDTRYCYLGKERLAAMERSLPHDALILGVDEHTACLLDLDARVATVRGNGAVTVRRNGRQEEFPAGSVVSFDDLRAAAVGRGAARLYLVDAGERRPGRHGAPDRVDSAGPADQAGRAGRPQRRQPSLGAAADDLDARFRDALSARDVDTCVRVLLELEQTIQDWNADTLASDERDHARGLLRGMVVALAELATRGATDPRVRVAPFVRALLDLRTRARELRDYGTSDQIRDTLAGAGVDVRDTPDGTEWHLAE